MNLSKFTNIDLIALLENATELVKIKKYRSKKFIEEFIGLGVHKSYFYGIEDARGNLTALDLKEIYFNTNEDITFFIEGAVVLEKLPVNTGTGTISYKGLGTVTVDDVIQYDGRTGGYMKGENNLSDVDSRQLSLDYLSDKAAATAGQVLGLNPNNNTVEWIDAGGGNITNNIFVDSVLGDNGTGDGTLGKPFATPEYALTQIDNAHQILVTRGAGTDTLTGISDINNALIKEGDFIEATDGIFSYGTFVVSKNNEGGDANTILLSQPTLGGGGSSNTYFYTPTKMILNGNFNITSSLFKQGVYIENNGTIYGENITLLDIGSTIQTIPYLFFKNNNTINLSGTSSRLYYESAISSSNVHDHICDLDFGNAYSEGLGEAIYINRYTYREAKYKINAHLTTLGKCAYFGTGLSIKLDGYYNGLLGGFVIKLNSPNTYLLNGIVECPSSLYALDFSYQGILQGTGISNMNVFGSMRCNWNGDTECLINGNMEGSVFSSSGDGLIVNGNITASTLIIQSRGSVSLNGSTTGDTTFINTKIFKLANHLSGSLTITNSVGYVSIGKGYNKVFTEDIILSGGSTLYYFSPLANFEEFYYSGLTVAAGCRFINNGDFRGRFKTSDSEGEIINNGYFELVDNNGQQLGLGVNGTFINKGKVKLESSGGRYTTFTYQSNIVLNGGTYIEKGELDGSLMSISPCIKKNSGKYIMQNGNMKSVTPPIQCVTDDSDGKDIYWISGTTNLDGTIVSVTQAFDGSSFAPNFVKLGSLIEDINL